MTSLGVALLLPFPSPAAAGGGPSDGEHGALARAANRCWLPLIDALDEGVLPAGTISVHLGGACLRWLEAHDPGRLEVLLRLVRDGRIEAVGGPWAGAILPALPERDATAQVQELSRWWRTRTGSAPRGAWLPFQAWDPTSPRILGRLGVQYAVLRDQAVAPASAPDGWWLTEREGTRLGLFVADTRLDAMLGQQPAARILRSVAQRGKEGTRCVVLVPPAAALANEETPAFGPRGWGRKLLAALADAAHWLKPIGFNAVMERMSPAGRIYPAPSIAVAPSPMRPGPPAAGEGRAWEWTLCAHPEVDRLHKRMLRTSGEVHRLQVAVRAAPSDDPRLRVLEQATAALWQGQDGHAYVVNAERGAQHPEVRHAAWSALLRAEELVARVFGEHGRVRCEQVDDDCDGQSEIEVRTARTRAVVAPGHGGALVELDAWGVGNLLNIRTRRPEAIHTQLTARSEANDELEGEADEPTHAVVTRPFARGVPLWMDVHLRGCFADHFLPPSLTAEALTGRWLDAGDFVGRPYRLLHLDDEGTGPVVVGLAREGNVTDGTGLRLVRVLKRLAFARDGSTISARYELANRYSERLRARFGVAFNLGLDGLPRTTHLEVDGQRVRTGAGGAPAATHEATRRAVLLDTARGLRVSLETATPGTLWHAPVTTHSNTPDGPAELAQGIALLLSWNVDLAPGERLRQELTLHVESGR